MLSIERQDRIYLMTVDSPPVNALDSSLLKELIKEIAQASVYENHAIIITGMPGHFCAGLDKKEVVCEIDEVKTNILSLLSKLLASIAHCPIPIATAITGHCLGGGAVLAALCDYRIMEQGEYKLGMPEVTLGLQLPEKVQQILARLVGEQFAAQLCIEGYLINPQQARQQGFIDELVEPNKAVSTAMNWCEKILSQPQKLMLARRTETRRDLHLLYETN